MENRKYFVFCIEDGTIYDRNVISIFNKYNIRATFALNSGLDYFVWYKDDKPVRRLSLPNNVDLYNNHEVASHSLTHPHLTMCPDEIILKEVGEDINNLENIFHREIKTFTFPFSDFDERCINLIKDNFHTKCIGLPYFDKSFSLPKDTFHIPFTIFGIDDALRLIDEFINGDGTLFIYVGHSYDFEFDNSYEKLEKLCQILTKNHEIANITMSEIADIL